jgi:hypothetical protein
VVSVSHLYGDFVVVSVAPALETSLYPILWMANLELQQIFGEKETVQILSTFHEILDETAGLVFLW